MNIFTLTVFILFILSGYFMGKFIGFYYGIWGWIIGFLIGFSIFASIYYLIMHFSKKYFPSQPQCKKGKCLADDYEILEYNLEEGTVIFCCKCGTKYFQNFPYFKEILPDGSLKPYMKKNKWGRWKPDI